MDRNLTILLAEDDEDYAMILESAIRSNGWQNQIHIVSGGQEAIQYLAGEDKYADRSIYPFPSVMFLDVKMPGVNGFDVLQWVREHPDCSVVPTIMLSSSDYEKDVRLAYQLGATGYLAKPPQLDDLRRMLQAVYDFWGWCIKPQVPAA